MRCLYAGKPSAHLNPRTYPYVLDIETPAFLGLQSLSQKPYRKTKTPAPPPSRYQRWPGGVQSPLLTFCAINSFRDMFFSDICARFAFLFWILSSFCSIELLIMSLMAVTGRVCPIRC